MSTGLVWHETYMWHDPGNFAGLFRPVGFVQPGEHVEHAESKRRLKNLLDATGFIEHLTPIKPRPATQEELRRFHVEDYLNRVEVLSQGNGGDAGKNAWFSANGAAIAKLSAGGVIEAVEAVMTGRVSNAYALVRPPGHHAEPTFGRGFCIYGNAGIAAMHAFAKHRIDRIAFVDWDVHHGNGQQAGFWEDPRALTISIHQNGVAPPDSGYISEIGAGKGAGYNINIPLPPGCGKAAYERLFESIVIPALYDFRPDLIIVPCGFDAGIHDPLGRMVLLPSAFASMTRMILAAANDLCGGRLVMCHEGGYSVSTVPFLALAVFEELTGRSAGFENPIEAFLGAVPGQNLEAHQEAAIEQARAVAVSHAWRRQPRLVHS